MTEAHREHGLAPANLDPTANPIYRALAGPAIETTFGRRYVDSAEVTVGGIHATLFSITEQKVNAGTLVEQSGTGAADRALTPAAKQIMDTYPRERWLAHNSTRGSLDLPFVPLEHYLDNPQRVSGMTVEVDSDGFKLNPALQPFKDRLIAQQLAAGRRITDGANTGVTSFDPTRNIIRLRRVGYYDMFTTQNAGSDMLFDAPIMLNNRRGDTIRELAGGGLLPDINEESLTTNSLGLGAVLMTGDHKLLLCRRKGNLGVTSASGTFGFSAAGNLPWDEALRQELDHRPAHEALAARGIAKEAEEELGLGARFANPVSLLGESVAHVVERKLGMESGECTVTPAGIMRDALHMGHPQTAYYLQTGLTAEEVIGRMLHSPDGKKEYDLVLAVDANTDNLDRIIRNEAADAGVHFNLEIRATLALLLSQEKGRALLSRTK